MEAMVFYLMTSLSVTVGWGTVLWRGIRRRFSRLRSEHARFDLPARTQILQPDAACQSEGAVLKPPSHLLFEFHPAATENVLILLRDSCADSPIEDTLTRCITANGLAQVYLSTTPDASRFPSSARTDQGERLDAQVNALIEFVHRQSPTAPIYVAGFTPTHKLLISLFESQTGRVGNVPDLSFFVARDGTRLAYRHYLAATNIVFILLHGASAHSGLVAPLAQALSRANRAQVFTPNLRGHFRSGARWGDIDYIGQLEDDLQDLIQEIKKTMPESRIIIGGHSLGAGLAVRFAGGKYGESADGYVLLAPYLGPLTKTQKNGQTHWVKTYRPRALALFLLNALRVRALNHLTIVKFDSTALVGDRADTLHYSYRLFMSMSPRTNLVKDLRALSQPLLVLIGEQDELLDRESVARLIQSATGQNPRVVPCARHLSILYSAQGRVQIDEWFAGLATAQDARKRPA